VLLDAVGILIGLAVLIRAGDAFVAAAARLAALLHVRPIVVGALVVGLGTSVPELLVAGIASAQRSPQIALGSLVGSNIANVSVILAVAAFVAPVRVDSRTIRREAPLSVAAVALFALLARDGLSPADGIVLTAALATAVVGLILNARSGRSDDVLGYETIDFYETPAPTRRGAESGRAGLSLILVLLGAEVLVRSAIGLAGRLGIAEGFVGLTLVALGTSSPELVSAVQAARRGDDDLVVGNLLGSNLINSLAGGAIVAWVGAARLGPSVGSLPLVLMVGASVAAWAFMTRGGRVTRWEGAILLAVYLAMLPILAR